MKNLRLYGFILILALCAAGTAAAQDDGRKLYTTLSGAAEVPGPGDPDGSGSATITLNQGQAQVCFEITVANLADVTAAHIHEAVSGKSGPPVVTLTPLPNNNSASGCVSADPELIKRIRQTPQNFYVNVHSTEFPDGAIRGQLSKQG